MISKNCFTADWLEQKRRQLKTDPYLLERALHAFALLGHLAESGLDFVFKGGTSLLLYVPVIRRLSIDIDILCSAPAETLDQSVAYVASLPPFTSYKEEDRGVRGLPNRRHFRFFYTPVLTGNPAPFVPPGGRDADTMQITKQLFDVGELFGIAEDLSVIRRGYHRVFEQENQYRGGGFTHVQTLDDTLDAALHLSKHGLKGPANTPEAEKMTEGARKVSEHLVNYRFNLNAAKIAAAKAALLSRLVLSEGQNDSLTYWRTLPTLAEMSTLTIDGPWNRLQRLRSTSPEAFFYWQQAAKLQAMLDGF